MKILLIMPDGRIHKIKCGSLDISFREAPLTLTTLAALVPKELNAEITIIDKSVGQHVPYEEHFDLVGISVITGTALEGYEIADTFRKKGVPVVLGGIHVALMPEESLQHADVIIKGFAEQTWPQFLKDFNSGHYKTIYASDEADIRNLPAPRRDLQKPWGYMVPNTVFVTRGCKGNCDFCSVPAARYNWSKRPIDDVINEIKNLKSNYFAITDVHLTADFEYAKELFTAMIPLKKQWGGLAATTVAGDPELLDLMRKSGCSYLLLGFESFNPTSLQKMHKAFNKVDHYKDVVEKLHDHNIAIQGCFIFGFDEDDRTVFKRTVDYINELKIDIPRYALYTPYPQTALFKRLKAANRLLHENWYYYDTQHVVIKPAQMTPRELDEGFMWAYKNTFTVQSSLQRSLESGASFLVTFLGNLAYKIYIKRLFNDTNRFPDEELKEISTLPTGTNGNGGVPRD
jgi:radical SAM superfamily enzyme YgiQ (UPF0313 family)